MATLISVNVGLPRDVAWSGRLVHTGIWKTPVTGPVMARRLNLDGDGQGDLAGHGGEQRAVMVYQKEAYEHWASYLGRADLSDGQFGENFTVDGLPDDEVCIGDRYRIGQAEFEVTQPRTTCYRVGLRLEEPRMASLLVSHHRPGFYFRVLREGLVQAGDEIVKTSSGDGQISVASTDGLLYLPGGDLDAMRRLATVRALSPGWRQSFQERLDQAEHPPASGQSAWAPAWAGFRPMRVSNVVHETQAVTSLYLQLDDGGTLPAPMPGQYLTLRLSGAGEPAPVRSYSLSSSTADTYRLSIKREPHGVASSYLAHTLRVGDQVDVAAPRGEFVLDDSDGPVVLLSAGIGVTPVLAMLHALVAHGATRPVWWVHTTNSPATRAMGSETDRLIAALANGRRYLFYTDDRDGPPEPGIIRGRLDRSRLAELGLPNDANVYLCGPAGFMDAAEAALLELGMAPARIHTEVFASLSSINPGVLPTDHPAPHPPGREGTGPAITFARAGLTASFVESLGSLLEMAEACDVPTRWSCRTGVCQTCSTPLLSGSVSYSTEPLTPPALGEILLCCTRPDAEVVLDL